jgi:DNA-binding CsgD family transcriptional regulator
MTGLSCRDAHARATPIGTYSSRESDLRRAGRPHDDGSRAARESLLYQAALGTLEELDRGVVLLDAAGTVCYASRTAEAMAARRNGLLFRRGRLQFEPADANAAFDRFLANGTAPPGDNLVLRVDASRGPTPYRILARVLESRSVHRGNGAGYCVFIYEPNGGQKPLPGRLLANLYGLTAAEARLANELFGGRSVTDSAAACGISLNTAKSVLKRIFDKCAVHSQSELLLLLSLGPRTL